MTLFDRYLVLAFARAATLMLCVLLALFSFLALTEELEDVGTGAFTTADAVSVVVLTTPSRIIQLLPVTVLLGGVLGLGALANHRELLAMRAAGVSAWRLAGTLCGIALTVALSYVALQGLLVPLVERQAQEFRSKQLAQTALGGTQFWSRHERSFIRIGAVDYGRIPRDIEIYELDARGRLVHLLRADKADVINAREWLLHQVDEKRLDPDGVRQRTLASLPWASFLTPEQFGTLIAPAHALSAFDLYNYIAEMRGSGVDTRDYQAMLWHQLSLPVALFAMILLALPFVLGNPRTRGTGLRGVIGGALGIGFYLFQQITSHLAQILDLPAAPTALAPAVLVLLGALLAIRRLQ